MNESRADKIARRLSELSLEEETLFEAIKTAQLSFGIISKILQSDAVACLHLLLSEETDFAHRMYIRAAFAFIEGSIYAMKQILLAMHYFQPCFDEAEIDMLREIDYDLKANGKVGLKNRHLNTLSNVRFTFNCVEKATGSSLDIDFGATGWQSFKDALSVRHDLTHPKSIESLNLSSKEESRPKIEAMSAATEWFLKQMGKAISTDTFGVDILLKEFKTPLPQP